MSFSGTMFYTALGIIIGAANIVLGQIGPSPVNTFMAGAVFMAITYTWIAFITQRPVFSPSISTEHEGE